MSIMSNWYMLTQVYGRIIIVGEMLCIDKHWFNVVMQGHLCSSILKLYYMIYLYQYAME
jgi:hypothetical protein